MTRRGQVSDELAGVLLAMSQETPYLPSFSEIGDRMGVTRSAVSRALPSLMEDGEVAALTSPSGSVVQRTAHVVPPGEPVKLGGGLELVVWNGEVWILPRLLRLTAWQVGALSDWLSRYVEEETRIQEEP